MDFQTVRERMAEFLNRNGVEAVCAYPDGGRTRRDGAVAAVSVRACQGGPEGFRDYLGERYDEATGQWQYLNSYADSVVTTDTAGRYLLTNDTLTFIHMNIYALAAAGVVLVAIVVVYIAVKKRYWFW